MRNPFQLIRRIKNIMSNGTNYDSDYEGYAGYFLINDQVKTPEGYEGQVVGVEGRKVDVYIPERTMLEIYDESVLNLLNEDQSFSLDNTSQSSFGNINKDWTKKAYKTTKSHYCGHWMDKFKLNEECSVYLSARGTVRKDKGNNIPTYGCYMDSTWQPQHSIWLTPNAPNDHEVELFDQYYQNSTGAMYIKWPDMGVVPLKEYSQVIVWCMSRIMEKNSKLEIGCVGAHGRTGTVVAGLLVYNGMDGRDAIKEVRTKYCDRAIENKIQENLIVEYSKELRNLELKETETNG
jgi:protein-tyrosine phosphatase